MRKLILLAMLLVLCGQIVSAQSKKKRKRNKEDKVFVSASFNANLNSPSFTGVSLIDRQVPGTYNQFGTRTLISNNNNLTSLGFGIQKVKINNTYTEFIVTKFDLREDDFILTIHFQDEESIEPILGKKDLLFETAFRLEKGKYFKPKSNPKWQIGVGGGIAPYFFWKKTTPLSFPNFPTTSRLYRLQLNAISSIAYKIKPKSIFELKWAPSLLNFNHHNFIVDNPIHTENQRKNNTTEISFLNSLASFNLQYKYQILGKKDSKKQFKKKSKIKKKNDVRTNKIVSTTVTPFINIHSQNQEFTTRSIGENFSSNGIDTAVYNINLASYISPGLGIQFVKENGNYFELAITSLSFNQEKFGQIREFDAIDSLEQITENTFSEDKDFLFSFRYEFGKVFSDPYNFKKKAILSIGLGIEPYIANVNEVKYIGTSLKFIPTVDFKLSHRVFLNLKWTPSIANGYYQSIEQLAFLRSRYPNVVNEGFKEWNLDVISNVASFNVGMRMVIR